jgi:glycerophosphoryl diester phosphodiesterase
MMKSTLVPDAKRPLVFAHRGLSSIAPENTLAAFKLARDMHIPGVELDVHLTADGKLVVFHDHWTGRLAGADGIAPGKEAKGKGLELEKSSYNELRALDIGSWKGQKYSGERIFLLSELFEECGDSFYYDIELKSNLRNDYGLEAATAAAIKAARGGKGIADRCMASSFNPVSIARFKTLMPEIPTAIIWCVDDELVWPLRYGAGSWLGHADFLKPDQVKVTPLSSFRWRKLAGKEVVPWTVDEPAAAKRLLELGCSGIISNRPHELGVL